MNERERPVDTSRDRVRAHDDGIRRDHECVENDPSHEEQQHQAQDPAHAPRGLKLQVHDAT